MEVLDELNSNELMLSRRAAAMHVPIAGTFELLPICNMDCRMCYIKTTKESWQEQGEMLTAEEWIAIAEEAKEMGLLYLLITGGEPLLYPEFEKVYTWLCKNGIIVMLNTNGTLLNERIVSLLKENPPRKVNISLYGGSAETYEKLCNYAGGFDRVLNGAAMLKRAGIAVKFNSSLTPLNCNDLEKMHSIAADLDIPLQVTPYMFPPVRKIDSGTEKFIRFQAKEAAKFSIENARLALANDEMFHEWVKMKLNIYEQYQKNPYMNRKTGIGCFGSKNNFWLNWKGEMSPCTMMTMEGNNVLEHGFASCWEKTGVFGANIQNPEKCTGCSLRPLCNICSAASFAETGSFSESSDYLCEMTEEFLRLLQMLAL